MCLSVHRYMNERIDVCVYGFVCGRFYVSICTPHWNYNWIYDVCMQRCKKYVMERFIYLYLLFLSNLLLLLCLLLHSTIMVSLTHARNLCVCVSLTTWRGKCKQLRCKRKIRLKAKQNSDSKAYECIFSLFSVNIEVLFFTEKVFF